MSDPRKKSNPRTTNEILTDRAIRHGIFLVRLAGGEVKDLEKQLPKLRREITKVITPMLADLEGGAVLSQTDAARIDEIGRRAAEVSKEFFDEISEEHIARLGEIGAAEVDFEKRLFEKAIPIERNFNTPSNQFIASLLANEPISGRRMNEWFTQLSMNTRSLVSEQIREGMMEGESINQILRRVRGRRENGFNDGILARQGQHAKTLVRSGVMTASNRAREAFHEQNMDVIRGWQIVITLDSRVCMQCVSMESGNPYDLTNKPSPPFHPGCRCLVTAVTKSYQELGIDLQELEPGERAAVINGMKGEVPDTMEFPEFFELQSEAFKKDHLGPSRYELYKQGKPVTAFADRGQILTLDELQRIDPI